MKAIELNHEMLMDQKGRYKFRQMMHNLGIANLNIMKYLMNVESTNFIKRQL